MDIYTLGQPVQTKVGDIEGILTAVTIRPVGPVAYEVSYFNGGDYKSVWLSETEFTVNFEQKHSIGFK